MVDIVYDEMSKKIPTGKAYVQFERGEDADTAVKFMNGAEIDGCKIKAVIVHNIDRNEAMKRRTNVRQNKERSRNFEEGRGSYQRNYDDYRYPRYPNKERGGGGGYERFRDSRNYRPRYPYRDY